MSGLYVVRIGASERLERLLRHALEGREAEFLPMEALAQGVRDGRILFAVAIDALGADESFVRALRILRGAGECLRGSVAAMVVDGADELYTKSAAQELALSANLAGCTFPGKSLVEGTGSLYNQHILAKRLELGWEETYFTRARDLVDRLLAYEPLRFAKPNVLIPYPSSASRGDQIVNAASFEKHGFSFVLDQAQMTPQTLSEAIFHVYHNKEDYVDKMKKAPYANGKAIVLEQIYKFAKNCD